MGGAVLTCGLLYFSFLLIFKLTFINRLFPDNFLFKWFYYPSCSLLLWMLFVKCPIHPNCCLQAVQTTVLTDTLGNSCYGSGTEMGRAGGDGFTDQTNHMDIDKFTFQTQAGENFLGVF